MLTGKRSQTRLDAMSTRAQRYDAVVLSRARISPHLLRLTLSVKSGDLITLTISSNDCNQATTCTDGCLSIGVDGRNRDMQFVKVDFFSVSPHPSK